MKGGGGRGSVPLVVCDAPLRRVGVHSRRFCCHAARFRPCTMYRRLRTSTWLYERNPTSCAIERPTRPETVQRTCTRGAIARCRRRARAARSKPSFRHPHLQPRPDFALPRDGHDPAIQRVFGHGRGQRLRLPLWPPSRCLQTSKIAL